jgi:hypothetical protein
VLQVTRCGTGIRRAFLGAKFSSWNVEIVDNLNTTCCCVGIYCGKR